MKKRVVALLLLVALLVGVAQQSVAVYYNSAGRAGHSRDKHNQDIEFVLLGDRYYISAHSDSDPTAQKVKLLEYAVYLALDQYDKYGQSELDALRKAGVEDLPASINAFAFTSNYAHRKFTHNGWEKGDEKIAHWSVREDILKKTVRHLLFPQDEGLFNRIWEKITGASSDEDKINSFCALLYYTHVLGDHLEASDVKSLRYITPLVELSDMECPGMISDLIVHLRCLFQNQKRGRASPSLTLELLIGKLDQLEMKAKSIASSLSDLEDPERFNAYRQCAEELLNTLATYVPMLLANEQFFKNMKE